LMSMALLVKSASRVGVAKLTFTRGTGVGKGDGEGRGVGDPAGAGVGAGVASGCSGTSVPGVGEAAEGAAEGMAVVPLASGSEEPPGEPLAAGAGEPAPGGGVGTDATVVGTSSHPAASSNPTSTRVGSRLGDHGGRTAGPGVLSSPDTCGMPHWVCGSDPGRGPVSGIGGAGGGL
jgi:hypothetical protein